MSIKIIIPSAGRSDNVLTNIDNQIICVPENEIKEYKIFNSDFEIISHPKLKNLAAKRNWILNKFGEVFMIDDDMVSLERVYVKTNQVLSSKEAYNQVQQLFYQAKHLNAMLFGFSEDPSPNHYNPYKPLMLKGISGGGAYGILKDSKLFFTENTTACDSHFVTLLNTYKNRYSLIEIFINNFIFL
ncbi:unnamed protein product [marine sediment metagenome]|uniref:TET-Associated Glycosyltransferase domain-containing protein n=1 Tax=marine sediment metagenome TaxID=412755 RepID=X1UNP8_9ZZZZ